MTVKYNNSQSDILNCSQFSGSRRTISFPAFVNNTDEKSQTMRIMGSFLDDYLPGLIANLTSCDVVDLGFGNGDLPYKISKYMNATCNKKIIYQGIEKEDEFVDITNAKLSTLEFIDSKLIQGDCFGEDIDKLVNNPVLLISSQVIFYLNGSFDEYIKRIVQKTGLVAIIIAQADGSYLNKVGQSYGDVIKKTETEGPLYDALLKHDEFSHIKILYSSFIYFPSSITYEKLIEIAFQDFAMINPDSQDYQTRALLEFVAGRRLEYLRCTNELEYFIGDTYTNIKKNSGNVRYWNYMTITAPKTNINQEEMQKAWQKAQNLSLSGNITSFEASIQDGNYEIAYALFKQGIVTCELRNDYHYSFFKEKLSMINSYFRYELRLSLGWQEILKFLFDFDLDERAEFRIYTSPEIIKMQSIKYNYTVRHNIPNPVDVVNNSISSEGNLFREWSFKLITYKLNITNSFSYISSFSALFEICFTIPLIGTLLIVPGRVAKAELGLGLYLMYNSFWKKFFYTSNSAIHYIKGDDFLLQLYLFDEKYYDSLKFQNSQGQTSLHKAILTSNLDNTIKVDNLLSCSKSIVDSIINKKDVRGKLPLHYAAYQENLGIIKNLLLKGTDINAPIEPSLLSLAFDLCFLSGKIIYLHGYFTRWIVTEHIINNLSIYQKSVTLGTLGIVYFASDYLNIKFPDTVYYFAFLNRLNSYDNWDNVDNINKTYLDYSFDTVLHISAKKNYTDIVKYLIKNNSTNINALNAKGESALHFAAANNNYELLDLLLQKNININHQAIAWPYYKLFDCLMKSSLIYFGSKDLLKTVSELIFIKVIHDEIFGSTHAVNSATALHYAIGGINLSDLKLNDLDLANSHLLENRNILYLIQNGADPELAMSYHPSFIVEIMPYIITKTVAMFIPISTTLELTTFLISQSLLYYSNIELRAIDLLQENLKKIDYCLNKNRDDSYETLKQFSISNIYNDINKLTWLNPKYFLYKLKIISDDDEIHMKDYGMYKGGSGRDNFYVYCNFLGRNDGKSIIIKDYKIGEDKIVFSNCSNHYSIDYKIELINFKNSTILYYNTDDNAELVTLFDLHINSLGDINFKFEEY